MSNPQPGSAPTPCNCDQSLSLAAELAVVRAERDYLVAFADPKEVAAMRRELAAEHEADDGATA